MGRKAKDIKQDVNHKDVNLNIVQDRVGETTDLSVCPICQEHTDCFANIDGKCTALKKVRDAADCPFYKNTEVNKAECRRCYQRLKENERYDLISKYIEPLTALGLLDDELEKAELCSEELELFREQNYREQLDAMKDEAGLDYDLLNGRDGNGDGGDGRDGAEHVTETTEGDKEAADDRNT